MSVKVNVRLPDEMHATLKQISEADGCTLSDAIIGAITDGLHVEPYVKVSSAPRSPLQVAATIPTVTTAAKLPVPGGSTFPTLTLDTATGHVSQYKRPSHAANCRCGMCQSKS